MSTAPIHIRIPTASLRQLLESEPDIKAQLESMACEKIAEEITRKVVSGRFEQALDAKLADVAKAVTDQYSARYRFPQEAKNEITRATSAALKESGEQIKRELRHEATVLTNDIKIKLDNHIAEQHAQWQAKIQASIRQIARAEFISVMQDVKKVVA